MDLDRLVAYERHPGAANRPLAAGYRRREPERSALHQLVSEHLETLLDQARERSDHGFGYPAFVEQEFEAFLGCGRLRRGFVRVKCSDCPAERLVAFSCKRRGICPSCTARRMANTAAYLVDDLLPELPYRQWVISFPKRVRFALACDHTLLSRVLDRCLKKIFAWQRRRARAMGIAKPQCGSVTFCQRFGSLLNLNCHFHSLLPDGVYTQRGLDVEFVAIEPPTPRDIARLVAQIARVTEKCLARRRAELADRPFDLLEVESARRVENDRLANFKATSSIEKTATRAASLFGYSLHAERAIAASDRDNLERLCRYGARAPIANSRLSIDDRGAAVVELKRPLHDGRTHLVIDPVELLQKLAVLIPPPRKNLTRYHGVFAPAHHLRAAIVINPAEPQEHQARPRPPFRLHWAQLLRRVFAIDVLSCERCNGSMTIIAVIPASPTADKILDHLNLEMPTATGPPASPRTN